jgi:hypothetical protein
MGIPTATQGIDWLELLVQVAVAAIGVAIVAYLGSCGVSAAAKRARLDSAGLARQ